MIRTQLCPAGELEDKRWWTVDVAVLVICGLCFFLLVNSYIDSKREDIQALSAKQAKWQQELQTKKPSVEKFKNLKTEMELLNKKIGALKLITTSKIDKVKPLIALDQLQTLWIDGVWYNELEYKADGTTTIKGFGNDSLMVGEYMLGIRETMNVDTVNDDMRTQVGFADVILKSAKAIESSDSIFPDIQRSMEFEMTGRHTEKKHLAVGAVSMIPRPRPVGYSGF